MRRGNDYLEFEHDESTGHPPPPWPEPPRQPHLAQQVGQQGGPGAIILLSIVVCTMIVALGNLWSDLDDHVPGRQRPTKPAPTRVETHRPRIEFPPVQPVRPAVERAALVRAATESNPNFWKVLPYIAHGTGPLAPREHEVLTVIPSTGYGCRTALALGGRVLIDGMEKYYSVALCEPESTKRIYAPGEVTEQAQLQYMVRPEYTGEARRARRQGIVFLHIVIRPTGAVGDIKIVRPLGFGLDEKAVEAIRQWHYRPAYNHGVPVPVWRPVEVSFRLL